MLKFYANPCNLGIKKFQRTIHTLPALPYSLDALSPHISKETLDFHYNKHHQTYVTKLNALVEGNSNLSKRSLIELVSSDARNLPAGVYNNAAQIWNHTFYWNSLTPPSKFTKPSSSFVELINKSFGSFDNFKNKFSDVAAGHFGSGWAWLVLDTSTGLLKIIDTHDAVCPLSLKNIKPLLTCDVWEHAYYIDYRNARPKYVSAWWNLVNWKFAEQNLKSV
jgi:Fe-Mn family superoxide dismutase